MHDLERNKVAAASYLELLSKGDIKALDALLADDLDYWILGNLPGLSGSHKKPALLSMIPSFTEMWDGPLVFTVTGLTAEEDRVALEARNKGRTKSGKTYENAYHIAFELRDGRITRIREYCDTIHVRDVIL
jgi:ketosteroid isomerase-like protein